MTNRSGAPNIVRLLSDAGTGDDYETPGSLQPTARQSEEAAQIHRYIQLPPELWTLGWMAVLSPAALAMLIVLRIQVGASPRYRRSVDFPDYAKKAFLLSRKPVLEDSANCKPPT